MRFERKSKQSAPKEKSRIKFVPKTETIYPPYDAENPTIESCEREIARLEQVIAHKIIHSRDDIPELEEALMTIKEKLAILSLTR